MLRIRHLHSRLLAVADMILAMAQPALAQSTRDIDDALAKMAERGELRHGTAPQTFTQPARLRYELGAVVDVRQPDRAGLPVLAVTPNGAGQRLGLNVGDRIRAINGRRLDGSAAPAPLLQSALDAGNGRMRVELERNGARQTLEGAADVVSIAAYQITISPTTSTGCSHVTNFSSPIRRGSNDRLAGVVVQQIDGRMTHFVSDDRLNAQSKLLAGRRTLLVAERLGDGNSEYSMPRGLTARNLRFRAVKPLVIDVQPGKLYEIGARVLVDEITMDNLRRNDYWEPVVTNVSDQRCN